jgi:hypothetical protein
MLQGEETCDSREDNRTDDRKVEVSPVRHDGRERLVILAMLGCGRLV